MTQAASDAEGINDEVLAAVMAAVQHFLEEESLSLAAPDGRLNFWRLAVRDAAHSSNPGASGSWRGIG